MILYSAVYVDGRRVASFPPDRALERCSGSEGFAWIDLQDPNPEELASIMRNFNLPEIVTREISKTHQRPKLQRIGKTSFMMLKSARYLEGAEAVELGEIHVGFYLRFFFFFFRRLVVFFPPEPGATVVAISTGRGSVSCETTGVG